MICVFVVIMLFKFFCSYELVGFGLNLLIVLLNILVI